jgi:hypothetical protein
MSVRAVRAVRIKCPSVRPYRMSVRIRCPSVNIKFPGFVVNDERTERKHLESLRKGKVRESANIFLLFFLS